MALATPPLPLRTKPVQVLTWLACIHMCSQHLTTSHSQGHQGPKNSPEVKRGKAVSRVHEQRNAEKHDTNFDYLILLDTT